MTQRVTTQYGTGTVVDEQTVRGVTSYKVEGPEFSMWLTAAQIPEFGQMQWDERPRVIQDNSTTLPYNPRPQFHPHDGTSTIQPNQHLDPEKRLSPADSVTFQPGSRAPIGPSNHLFAGRHTTAAEMDIDNAGDLGYEDGLKYGEGERRKGLDYMPLNLDYMRAWPSEIRDQYTRGFSEGVAEAYPDAGTTQYFTGATTTDMSYNSTSIDEEFPGGLNTGESDDTAFMMGASYSYAPEDIQDRLGSKYADVPTDVDHGSITAKLEHDPHIVASTLSVVAEERNGGVSDRVAQQMALEASDSRIRTAAWADVRAKGVRIRGENGVDTIGATPESIYAYVLGDHDVYETIVVRGAAFTGNNSITEWDCTCEWGHWAFKRMTYHGRLCSHAYAAYLEMQSQHKRKDKSKQWYASKGATNRTAALDWQHWDESENGNGAYAELGSHTLFVEDDRSQSWYIYDETTQEEVTSGRSGGKAAAEAAASERDLTAARYPREDGQLSLEPGTLTPDLRFVPNTHERRRIDVTAGEHTAGNGSWEGDDTYGWALAVQDVSATVLRGSHDQWVGRVFSQLGDGDSLFETVEDDAGMAREAVEKWLSENRDIYIDASAINQDVYGDEDSIDVEKEAFLSEPFEGTGPANRDSIGSSEQYLEGEEYDDVEGPGDNPAVRNGDDVVLSSFDGDDPSSRSWLMEGSNGGGNDDIAAAAAEFLRTAGRQFTMAEQQDLIDEAPSDGMPFDQASLDLKGTHYLP